MGAVLGDAVLGDAVLVDAVPPGRWTTGERETALRRCMAAHPAGRARAVRVAAPVAPRRAVAAPLPPLRLTARGRRLLVALGLAAGVGVAALVGSLAGPGPTGHLRLDGQSSVVVAPGDTLWSIASTVAGDDDVRSVVARIQRTNGLTGTALVPGEVLRLP